MQAAASTIAVNCVCHYSQLNLPSQPAAFLWRLFLSQPNDHTCTIYTSGLSWMVTSLRSQRPIGIKCIFKLSVYIDCLYVCAHSKTQKNSLYCQLVILSHHFALFFVYASIHEQLHVSKASGKYFTQIFIALNIETQLFSQNKNQQLTFVRKSLIVNVDQIGLEPMTSRLWERQSDILR